METQGTMDVQDWPQVLEWEEFLFAGKLHRCGYASDRTLVLVVALGGGQTSRPLAL